MTAVLFIELMLIKDDRGICFVACEMYASVWKWNDVWDAKRLPNNIRQTDAHTYNCFWIYSRRSLFDCVLIRVTPVSAYQRKSTVLLAVCVCVCVVSVTFLVWASDA